MVTIDLDTYSFEMNYSYHVRQFLKWGKSEIFEAWRRHHVGSLPDYLDDAQKS